MYTYIVLHIYIYIYIYTYIVAGDGRHAQPQLQPAPLPDARLPEAVQRPDDATSCDVVRECLFVTSFATHLLSDSHLTKVSTHRKSLAYLHRSCGLNTSCTHSTRSRHTVTGLRQVFPSHIYIYIYVSLSLYIYIYIHVHIHTPLRRPRPRLGCRPHDGDWVPSVCMYVHMHIYIYIYMCMYNMCVYIYIYIYTYSPWPDMIDLAATGRARSLRTQPPS